MENMCLSLEKYHLYLNDQSNLERYPMNMLVNTEIWMDEN